MHANLHTEFIHSVSFLISEDLNAHLLSGPTRHHLWHSHVNGKLNRAQIERLKCLTAAGLNCNFKSWLNQFWDGIGENNEYNLWAIGKNDMSSEVDSSCYETSDTTYDRYVTSHSKTSFFVSNTCSVNKFVVDTCDNVFLCLHTGSDSSCLTFR